MSAILPGLLAGAAFGAALTASGVHHPSVIVSQLKLDDWHMLRAFLTAAAGSGVVAALLKELGYVELSPRGYSTIGLFGRADANLIGGALLGSGMFLSGSCPGTVASQVAVGIASGYWTLGGGVLGGLAWTGFLRGWAARRKTARAASVDAVAGAQPPPRLTVYESLGVSYLASLAGFELLVGAAVTAATVFGTHSSSMPPGAVSSSSAHSHLVSPIVGGLLIAAAQLVSVLARKALVGTSGAFDEIGDSVWWLSSRLGSRRNSSEGRSQSVLQPRPKPNTIIFVGGIMLGSLAVALSAPSLVFTSAPLSISPSYAALGGFTMVVGSRMAGGCTSGHGISGVSLLSVSSIITIVSAFVSGSLVAKFLS